LFRIGEFAQLSGLSTRALRNYDVRGIFHPAWTDPQTGYRYYSPAQLPQLRRLIALRDLGIPLADVARLLADGADLSATLERQRAELEIERSRIEANLVALGIRLETGRSGSDIVERMVSAQRAAVVGIGDHDVEGWFNHLEAVVRDSHARAPLPPGMLVPVSGERVEIFVPVSRPVEGGDVVTRRLPAESMATALHRGPYEGMQSVISEVEAWVTATGRISVGPRRILYLQFGADPGLGVPDAYLADHPRDYLTEIQIPIRPRE
jgi:DNA-binding transcriptional MerR regulator